VSQAASYIVSKSSSSRSGTEKSSIIGIVYYNSIFTIIALVPLMLLTRSPASAGGGSTEFAAMGRIFGLASFHVMLNGLSAFVLNFAIFLNCNVNSPLAIGVTGNAKAVVTTLVGVGWFQRPLTFLGILGLVLNTIGAALYSLLKCSQHRKADLEMVSVPQNDSSPTRV